MFEEMNAQATEDRKALGQWAFQAYTGGGSIVELTALLDSLNTPAAEAIDPVAHVAYLSDQRVHALERIQHLAANQRDVALRAVEARTRATDAALAAAQAKRQLDAVIARQRQELEATRALHEQQVARVGPHLRTAPRLGGPASRADHPELRKALQLPELFGDPSGQACTGDNRDYPNGALPARPLCPLVGSPGESLRPGAAASFNALSKAFERDTGTTICVTDSYRSLAEQVSVKADKGKWAATPAAASTASARRRPVRRHPELRDRPAPVDAPERPPRSTGVSTRRGRRREGSLPEPWHWSTPAEPPLGTQEHLGQRARSTSEASRTRQHTAPEHAAHLSSNTHGPGCDVCHPAAMTSQGVTPAAAWVGNERYRKSWYWYDWANSAYVTTTATVILGPYLTAVAKKAACPAWPRAPRAPRTSTCWASRSTRARCTSTPRPPPPSSPRSCSSSSAPSPTGPPARRGYWAASPGSARSPRR